MGGVMFLSWQFRQPTVIHYGFGVSEQAGQFATQLRGQRALVVCGPCVRHLPSTDRILRSLRQSGLSVHVYDAVKSDPDVATVDGGLAQLRQSQADVIVGLGGGSAMDCAKAIAILASNPAPITLYEGVDKVQNPAFPLILIPTTAGTASEVTLNVVVTDPGRRTKLGILSLHAAARFALVDPELTLSVPPSITAATGMDAFTHALESYLSRHAYPISEMLALDAMRRIAGHLLRAVQRGDDREARNEVMMGSVMAGLAFNNTRLGNSHAMSHPLGGHFHVPHGVANAIMLPHVMAFNVPAAAAKLARVAAAMGEDVAGLPEEKAAWVAVEAVARLNAQVGIPKGLREFGVDPAAIPAMAEEAMKSGNVRANPRDTTLEDIVALFEAAM
jgi:alcohol dehydrogenase class IV